MRALTDRTGANEGHQAIALTIHRQVKMKLDTTVAGSSALKCVFGYHVVVITAGFRPAPVAILVAFAS